MQAFPKIYTAAMKGTDVLRKMSSNGGASVDMSNLAGRITAGTHNCKILLTIIIKNLLLAA